MGKKKKSCGNCVLVMDESLRSHCRGRKMQNLIDMGRLLSTSLRNFPFLPMYLERSSFKQNSWTMELHINKASTMESRDGDFDLDVRYGRTLMNFDKRT
ncbi:unnamed protein product [Eruca vesicaria subsp. sativa]|uniref:Uncharacterized protein n=1 Tax=Eruca vesicaria subsp. sativa TaxID=29727 RepID=A0ABC8J4W4_ERUVS|nr:unnamed protein product [Eruca vesicaria subsp. sativa]